jgi:formylglycine-generating enzyme required for sulfatase activity
VTLRNAFILFTVLASAGTHADTCRDTVALLGNESDGSAEVSRERLMEQMAAFYAAALNDEVPKELVVGLVKELSEREGKSFAELMGELENRVASPREWKEREEERLARREQELAHLFDGLEPYLARLSRKHRKAIEDQLIFPGLVKPLSTGEVEFRFLGPHEFIVGDEGLDGKSKGTTREVSFGPNDGFAIGQVPVTQLMYFLAAIGQEDAVDPSPSRFKMGSGGVALRLDDRTYFIKPNHPVERVSWIKASAHAHRVSRLTGAQYELPTEKQWEFANRAGSTGIYHFGDSANVLPRFGWSSINSGRETHAVGELLPNGFNLYDTHGNVWEWTSTIRYTLDSYSRRVARGGSSFNSAESLLSAYRDGNAPDQGRDWLGLRLVRQSPITISPSHTFTFGDHGPGTQTGSVGSAGLRSLYQRLLNRMNPFRRSGR